MALFAALVGATLVSHVPGATLVSHIPGATAPNAGWTQPEEGQWVLSTTRRVETGNVLVSRAAAVLAGTELILHADGGREPDEHGGHICSGGVVAWAVVQGKEHLLGTLLLPLPGIHIPKTPKPLWYELSLSCKNKIYLIE